MPRPASNPSDRTCSLITLGCPKNLVDSERMLGLLGLEGYRLKAEPDGADLVIVNTCGFLQAAREESFGVIREMVRLKRRRRVGRVIVAGCLVQRDREGLLDRFPDVDQWLGVFARDQIAIVADRPARREDGDRMLLCSAPSQPPEDRGRMRLTPPHVAYLRIAEGCSRLCSFCTIPAIRDHYASKPIEAAVAEAEELAADGTRELIVIAQDTSFYGVDLYGQPRLAELLTRVSEVAGIEWIRVMYLYPEHITDALVNVLAAGGRVLPYVDLPLQHINDDILRRMRRQVTRSQAERLLDRLRERIEGLVLRTAMIVGFPGETDEQFAEVLEFVGRRRFERLGVFAYSQEEGTAAAALDGQLPEALKRKRRDRLMRAQQEIAFAWAEAQVGRRLEVLIDRGVSNEENAYLGRSYADAPEIDGAVYVTGENLVAGQIVPCEIVATREYDLIGVAVGPPR